MVVLLAMHSTQVKATIQTGKLKILLCLGHGLWLPQTVNIFITEVYATSEVENCLFYHNQKLAVIDCAGR